MLEVVVWLLILVFLTHASKNGTLRGSFEVFERGGDLGLSKVNVLPSPPLCIPCYSLQSVDALT